MSLGNRELYTGAICDRLDQHPHTQPLFAAFEDTDLPHPVKTIRLG